MEGADREAARDRARRRSALRNAVTVVLGREYLLKQGLARGDAPDAVALLIRALDAALARLMAAVKGLDDAD